MSAINVIQTHDAVFMFSDGAFVDSRTGNLVTTGAKVVSNVPGRFVVGVSGSQELLRHVGMISFAALDIDQARGDIEALLPQLMGMIDVKSGAFGIYLAGFSRDDVRQSWKIEGDLATQKAVVIRLDPDAWDFSPSFTSSALRLAIGDEKANKFDRCFTKRLSVADPLTTGMLAIEAQRKLPYLGNDAPGGQSAFVGAFAQVTIVTRDRIESRIVERWPDVCDQPIAPDGAAKVYHTGFGKSSFQPRALVGFKGANDAANGINTGASSNYAVNSSLGYVAPTTLSSASDAPNTTVSYAPGYTAFDTDFSVTNSATVVSMGVYMTTAKTIVLKIGKRNSAGNYDIVVTQSFAHPGGGWVDVALSSPYAVPGSGTFYAGIYSGNAAIDVQTAGNRAFKVGDITGSGQSGFTEAGDGSVPSVRVIYQTNNMTLVTASQTADSSVSNGRVLIEFDNTASPTLNTDLTVEVTCNGGTNWTAASLSSVTSYSQGGRKVVESVDQACTSGTSFAARIRTLNNKSVPIYGVSLTVH